MPEELEFSLQDDFFGLTEGFQDNFSTTAMALGSIDGRTVDQKTGSYRKDVRGLKSLVVGMIGEIDSYRRL